MPSQITDARWAELAPLVAPAKRSRAGAPAATPDRTFLDALLHPADSGGKWRQRPERFGAWDAVYNRLRRWLAAGVFERRFADLPPPRVLSVEAIRRALKRLGVGWHRAKRWITSPGPEYARGRRPGTG